MADEEKKDEAAPEEQPKKSKLPLILALVVLLAGGGGAAWYLGVLPFGRHHQSDAEATAAVAHEGETGLPDANALGAMLAMEPFIANLADAGGARYLKTTFQLEFVGATVPSDAEARMPQIRDLLLTLLTSKTYDEIRTPVGKQSLRDEIISRVNQVLDREAVKAVYFTEFIVQ